MTVPMTDSSDGVVWKNTNSSIAANTIYSTDVRSARTVCHSRTQVGRTCA